MSEKKNPRDIAEEILKGVDLTHRDKEPLIIRIKEAIKIERTRQVILEGKVNFLNAKIIDLKDDKETLATALSFYACDFNWHDLKERECAEYRCVHNDRGHLARVVLEQPQKDAKTPSTFWDMVASVADLMRNHTAR